VRPNQKAILASVPAPYPFAEGSEDTILAYWYNVPKGTAVVKSQNLTLNFQSLLQIYGVAPADSFDVSAQAYLANGDKIFEDNSRIDRGTRNESCYVDYRDSFFRLSVPVEYSDTNPHRIKVKVRSPDTEIAREFACQYYKLSGTITDFDGKPFRGFVKVSPDSFEDNIGVWSDSHGSYEVELPARTYNSVLVVDESYGEKTLECWVWHLIMDSDQVLDFRVGNSEVYNLSVWLNNGGGNSLFVSFRPMSLNLLQNAAEGVRINLCDKEFNAVEIAPDLGSEDIAVTVDGRELEVISLQRYYETYKDQALPAYIAQIDTGSIHRIGKKTLMVEYQNDMEIDGHTVTNTSVGYCQFFLNFDGLSFYQ